MLKGVMRDSAVIGTYKRMKRKGRRSAPLISYQQQSEFYFRLLCRATGQTQHLTKK